MIREARWHGTVVDSLLKSAAMEGCWSATTEPAHNLALDEWLVRARAGTQGCVLFYRNTPVAVVGRNQVPWLECDLRALRRANVSLHRRISGGGTVVHDLGTLNCSLILPRSDYDPGLFPGLVATALQRLGIAAAAGPRHSVWVGSRKVCGTAFMLTGKTVLLHGSILVDSDLERLGRCLQTQTASLVTHAVRSVPAPVANLREFCPDLTTDRVAQCLVEVVCPGAAAPKLRRLSESDGDARFRTLLAKQRGWAWTYGRTPDFRQEVAGKIGCRTLRAEFTVADGCVAAVKPLADEESDAWSAPTLALLAGTQYDADRLTTRLREVCPRQARRRSELIEWIRQAVPTAPSC